MRTRGNRIHPALKHGAYSATAVLPGESRAAFEKLHRDIISEIAPSGVLEDDIVACMAGLVWRKQNLKTLLIAEDARKRRSQIIDANVDSPGFPMLPIGEPVDMVKYAAQMRAAEEQIQKELGSACELIAIGEATTLEGLTKELDIKERLDAGIARCLKQLLLLRGVKSISATPTATIVKRIAKVPKAA